ncbi:NACHT, LRR and PYD domains-containing protein 3-like [Sardina pilchardus]
MIVLPFRDLNTMIEDDEGYSLQELLEEFCSELKDVKDPKTYENCSILFIFDGLDESRLPLDFHKNKRVSKVTKKCSVDALITNLIQSDRLLPSARIWITSRPAALHKVSDWTQTTHRLTEIQGFSDPQKEEYFRKKILDENLADRVISHIKTSRSFYIMCHIPVFCWISAMVFSIPEILDTARENIPTSLTSMYTRFLLHQMQKRDEKYYGEHKTMPLSETDMKIILKLGKLAFANLEKQNLVFSESDLSEHDINVTDVSIQSGVFTEVVKEEDPTIREKWYSFIHLTIQEYLAAFYVFYSFASEGSFEFPIKETTRPNSQVMYDYATDWWVEKTDTDDEDEDYNSDEEVACMDDDECDIIHFVQEVNTLHDLHKAAIGKALNSSNGHLDLFVRFLLGLSVEESLWRHFKLQTTRDQKSIEKTSQFIKTKLKEEDKEEDDEEEEEEEEKRKPLSPERCINLFHSLTELKDDSLVKEIQWFMTSRYHQKLSAAQCTALAYMITSSEKVMEEFDLRKYNTSREGQTRLIHVVERCISAKLAGCSLTKECCKTLAQSLQSSGSCLRELDLSHNDLGKPAVEALADGLRSSNCKLTCLDISFNDLGKAKPMDLLGAILLGPHTQPHTLRLSGCELKQDICDILAEAMEMPSSQLKNLDLSYNPLTDAGVETILQALLSKQCELETLRLCACYITEASCVTLAKVLQQSSLKDLDLSGNLLRDEGVKLVCTGLMSPHCRLNTLGLKECNLYKSSCAALAPVLWSFSELRDLDLSDNDLPTAGVRLLAAGLRNPNCFLHVLRMSGCQITERGCALLASALIRNPHHLEELDLSYNHPGESGIQLLSARLEDPHCHLQKLNMEHVGERHLKWGLKKYAVDLTCHQRNGVDLSEDGKKATRSRRMDMFYGPFDTRWMPSGKMLRERQDSQLQVECVQRLSGRRFYWEVDWTGVVSIGVKHNSQILCMRCCKDAYRDTFSTNRASCSFKDFQRIGVFLDWPAGTLSFYNLTLMVSMHTIHTTFSSPVTPFFGFEKPFPYAVISSINIRTF